MKRVFFIFAATTLLCTGMWSCEREEDNNGSGQAPAGWVDLGLPSGLLWAECNVGAISPEDYGNYYAWGETTVKNVYNWSTYRFCTVNANGDLDELTKYNTDSHCGAVDNLTALLSSDDVATANMGNGARMPTFDEWNELHRYTTHVWTTVNGVYGCNLIASNGQSLFLPAAGHRWNSSIIDVGESGYYWLKALNTNNPDCAGNFYCRPTEPLGCFWGGTTARRGDGHTVRAVRNVNK